MFYASNGGLCKKSVDDIGRDKQFSVLTIDGLEIEHEFVKVPCLSDDLLFDIQAREDRDAKEAQAFTAALARGKLNKNINPIEKVQKIGKVSKFSEDSIEEVVKRLKSNVN